MIQRSSTQPGAEPSTEALSHTSTQPHNGEMGTSTGSSGNGDCQEKVSEKQTLGREWVNIETPYVDPVLSRMDNDAGKSFFYWSDPSTQTQIFETIYVNFEHLPQHFEIDSVDCSN